MGCDLTITMATQAGQLELNVMMPVIAHALFEAMQVTIGAVRAFTEKAVRGVTANREKALSWLEKNAIVVTALNPLIGYAQGAALVKEAAEAGLTIREVAVKKAISGALRHREQERPVRVDEIEAALDDLERLTKGGIVGGSS
jgi:fumarate hydratase class II